MTDALMLQAPGGRRWFQSFNLRVVDPGLVTFPARPGKVTKRRPPLLRRPSGNAVLLDKCGGCEFALDLRKHILNVLALRHSRSPRTCLRLLAVSEGG